MEKLQSLLFASTRVTDGELKQRYGDKSVTMDAEYVLFDPNRFIPDSLVTVTDNDVEKHYNANQEDFKVRAARKLKYVFFNLAATSEDTATVVNEMNRLLDQAKSGMDFSEVAKTYSELPGEEKWVKHGELSRVKENVLFSAKKGEIVGPVKDFDGFHLIKVVDEKKGSAEFVRASHVLLNAVAGPDSVAKIRKIRDILKQLRSGADFATLAAQNSEDFSNSQSGGDLGWTGRGGWVKPFEQAAFGARVGELVGPVRTQFGWHLIKITGRDNREVKTITLSMKVKASPQSIDVAYESAQNFSELAKDEGFEKSAEFSSFQIRETSEFTKGTVIPGIGINDAVMNFAFKMDLDAISDPLTMTGGIAVFKISTIREEGVRPLEDVKGIVRSQVIRKKKLEKMREQVDAFHRSLTPQTELILAAQSELNATSQKTGPFKATDAPGVGRDNVFIGTAMTLSPGGISKPIEGSRGYYIIKMISKTPFDSTLFAGERATLREQILQEKRNRLFSDWLTALRENAEIEDNRDKFYR